MSSSVKSVPCPQCRRESPWDLNNPYRPFCSERCKLIDLGAWASESYRLPVQEKDDLSAADDTRPAE